MPEPSSPSAAQVHAFHERHVLVEHPVFQDESAGGDDDPASRTQRMQFAEHRGDDTDDRPVRLLYELDAAMVRCHLGGARVDGRAESLHQQRAGVALACGHVAPWCGRCELAVGVEALRTRPDEPIGGWRVAAAAVEDRVEGNALCDEPTVVLTGSLAVEPHLLLVRRLADTGHQVLEHRLWRILEATGLLELRAAAEVDCAAGHGRGAATTARAFENERLGPRGGRCERRRRARCAEPNDDHVDFAPPIGDVLGSTDAGGHAGSWSEGRRAAKNTSSREHAASVPSTSMSAPRSSASVSLLGRVYYARFGDLKTRTRSSGRDRPVCPAHPKLLEGVHRTGRDGARLRVHTCSLVSIR
jgi:hypothetical protein